MSDPIKETRDAIAAQAYVYPGSKSHPYAISEQAANRLLKNASRRPRKFKRIEVIEVGGRHYAVYPLLSTDSHRNRNFMTF